MCNACNTTYFGDPLLLTPLIKSIELLEEMDTDKKYEELLRSFVLTKLQGIAIEMIPENANLSNIKKILTYDIRNVAFVANVVSACSIHCTKNYYKY